MKKLLAVLIVVCMMLGALPTAVFAEEHVHRWDPYSIIWNIIADGAGVTYATATLTCSENAYHELVKTYDAGEAEIEIVTSGYVTEPDCTSGGEKQYVLAVNLEDEYDNGEIDVYELTTRYNVSVPALGHDLTYTPAVAATPFEAGNTAYWYCDRCERYFADEGCTEEIDPEDTVIPVLNVDEFALWGYLQEALCKGGTITLPSDATASAGDTALVIPKNVIVTLNMNGHTIDRALQTETDNGSVIIVNGYLEVNGQGVITGGNTSGAGGGIWIKKDGTLSLDEDVVVSGNHARNLGGGVYISGNDSNFFLLDAEISGNSAKNGGGLAQDNSGYLYIWDGEISGNTATNNGGGVWYGGGANSAISLAGGEITGNTAGVKGGGIYINGGTFRPGYVTVTGNTAPTYPNIGAKNSSNLPAYAVNVDDGILHGSVEASGDTAILGDTVTLTATPDTGYFLDYYTVTDADGDPVAVTGNTFVMPRGEVTVSASFKEITTHYIDADQNYQNGNLIYPVSAYTWDTVTVTADPDSGCAATSLYVMADSEDDTYNYIYEVEDVSRPDPNTLTFTMPDANVKIFAAFSDHDGQLVFIRDMEGGTVVPDKVTAQYGDIVTLTIQPDNGYEYVPGSLLITDVDPDMGTEQELPDYVINEITEDSVYSFEMYSSGYIAVYAEFTPAPEAEKYFVVIDDEIENGELTADLEEASEGWTVTLTAEPDARRGYATDSVTVVDPNGDPVTVTPIGGDRYTFTMPASHVFASASFIRPLYAVTVESEDVWIPAYSSTNAEVYADCETAEEWDMVSLIATVPDGCSIDSITVTGDVSGDTVPCELAYHNEGSSTYRYRFSMPGEPVTASVQFTKDTYTISLDSSVKGVTELSVAGTTLTAPYTATQSDVIDFTYTPPTGRALTSLTYSYVNAVGVTVTRAVQYTEENGVISGSFYMPASDVTVSAELEAHKIYTAEDWYDFASSVAAGEFTDDPWELCADISITTSVTTADYASGATVGTETHPFTGTFDGKGHTLTVDISDTYFLIIDFNVTASNQGAAPFRYIAGATIKDLTVDGTVYASGSHAAGLVGFNLSGESTIENCAVMTDVTCDPERSGYFGGVLGHNKSATVNMTDVTYGGAITTSNYNRNYVGGLVGWSDDSTVDLSNCIFCGTLTGRRDVFDPILVKGLRSNVTAEFDRTYYTEDPLTVWADNVVGGQYVINDTVSRRVFPGLPENTIYEYIIGPDGLDYHIPCTVEGIQPNYRDHDDYDYTVKNYYGEVLTDAYYTESLTRDGRAAAGLSLAGNYVLTLTGKNGYTGTYTKAFPVFEEVPYIDADGAEQTAEDFDVVESNTDVWREGFLADDCWYVVLGNVTIDNTVTVSGDVNLILCDGATLTVNGGIGVGTDSSLTIFAQSGGTGELITTGTDHCAGIGYYKVDAFDYRSCGDIVINGGVITATAGASSAGIGSGRDDGFSGSVTINGGTVTAYGAGWNPGIGETDSVTINGGTVTAYGGEGGAGIGSGWGEGCGNITINGGTVTGYGGDCAAAGIGGGRQGGWGFININGGTVRAYGGPIEDGFPISKPVDIGAPKGNAVITLNYSEETAAGMNVSAEYWVSPVRIEKAFYDEGTLEKFDVIDVADNSALAGKTLVPAGNYSVVSFNCGYGSGEMAEVPVVTGGEYTLPESTFTAPSPLRPFTEWLVKIGAGSTELMQPGDTITVTADTEVTARFRTAYMSLQTLIDNAEDGATITLDENYVSASGADTVFTIPAGKALTIDLNGHTIDRGLANTAAGENCNVFSVNGVLTIKDTSAEQTGTITGGNNSSAGGAIRVEAGATLNFEGGTITGNRSPNGGGIYNVGTVNVSGGTISGNIAANSGGGIFNNTAGTLNLTGGTVTNNSAAVNYHGGGIHTSGTMNLSGAPVVTGNTRGGAENNVGLYEGALINVVGELTSGASIGVNKSKANSAASDIGVFTTGLPGNGTTGAFIADSSDQCVILSENEEARLCAANLPGDVDGDGIVAAKDARLLKQYLAGLVGDDGIVFANADLNGDGVVSSKDYRELKALMVQ